MLVRQVVAAAWLALAGLGLICGGQLISPAPAGLTATGDDAVSLTIPTPTPALVNIELYVPQRFATADAPATLVYSSHDFVFGHTGLKASSEPSWVQELVADEIRSPVAGEFVIEPTGTVWILSATGDQLVSYAPEPTGPPLKSLELQLRQTTTSTNPAVANPELTSIDAMTMRIISHDTGVTRIAMYARLTDELTPRLWVLSPREDTQQVCTGPIKDSAIIDECTGEASLDLEMWVPNEGRPLGSVYIYLRCSRSIIAVDDACNVLWQTTFVASESPSVPVIQGISSSTSDLFVLVDSIDDAVVTKKVVRLIAESGAQTNEVISTPFNWADEHADPSAPEVKFERSIQSLTPIPDGVSCASAASTTCTDKMTLQLFQAVPTDPAVHSFAFLEAWVQNDEGLSELAWSTLTNFRPHGGLHSKPVAFRSGDGREDVIIWIVRSDDFGDQSTYSPPIVHVVDRIDGTLKRSYDLSGGDGGLYTATLDVGCQIVDALPDMTLFLSCPVLYEKIFVIQWADPLWVEAVPAGGVVPDEPIDTASSSSGAASGGDDAESSTDSSSSSTAPFSEDDDPTPADSSSSTAESDAADPDEADPSSSSSPSSTGATPSEEQDAAPSSSSTAADGQNEESSSASSTAEGESDEDEASFSPSSSSGAAPDGDDEGGGEGEGEGEGEAEGDQTEVASSSSGAAEGEGEGEEEVASSSSSSSSGVGVADADDTGGSGKSPTSTESAADVTTTVPGLHSIVIAFIVIFGLLAFAIIVLVVVRHFRRDSNPHLPLTETPRVGAGLMLDGTLDPDFDPSEARVDFSIPDNQVLDHHTIEMIELEAAIGAGLGGPLEDDVDEELEFGRDERPTNGAYNHVSQAHLNSPPSSSGAQTQKQQQKLTKNEMKKKGYTREDQSAEDQDAFDL